MNGIAKKHQETNQFDEKLFPYYREIPGFLFSNSCIET